MEGVTVTFDHLQRYFTPADWKAMSDYEKLRYHNMKQNYDVMLNLGLGPALPEFMQKKSRQQKPAPVVESECRRRSRDKKHDEDAESEQSESDREWLPCAEKSKRRKRSAGRSLRKPLGDVGNKAYARGRTVQSAGPSKQCRTTGKAAKSKDLNDAENQKSRKCAIDQAVALPLPDRYPKRARKPLVNVPSFLDEFLADKDFFCDDCDELLCGFCPLHPLNFIPDNPVDPINSSVSAARQSLPKFLSFGQSRIKGAGLGVWTEQEIARGTAFGPYKGCKLVLAGVAEGNGYAWKVSLENQKSIYIDAKDESQSNWLRFVNCACTEDQQNLIAFEYEGQIYYRAYKQIRAYTELLAPARVHPCPECDVGFTSLELLDQHMLNRHQKEQKTHACTQCSYSTEWLSYLERHVNSVHLKLKPFVCDTCGKSFTQSSNLKIHALIHSGARPYKCDKCGKSFNHSSSLNSHMLLHSADPKQYACTICGRSFTLKHNLTRHHLVHAGVKKHQCSDCDMRFVRAGDLRKHERTHTGEKPYECSHCQARFTQSCNLKDHIKRHHAS